MLAFVAQNSLESKGMATVTTAETSESPPLPPPPASMESFPVLLAEYSCARCWKQKKKCDRVTPRCGRCSKLSSACVFAQAPPKACVFAVEGGTKRKIEDISSGSEEARDEEVVIVPHHEKLLRSHLSEICTDLGGIENLQHACETYFSKLHNWIPFIDEYHFWGLFDSFRAERERGSGVSTKKRLDGLLLIHSIFLLAYEPSRVSASVRENVRSALYEPVKACWAQMPNVRLRWSKSKSRRDGNGNGNGNGVSVEQLRMRIRIGLLLGTYEHAVGLEAEAGETVKLCVWMAREGRLDVAVKNGVVLGLGSAEEQELDESRTLWWAIVVHERLLTARTWATGCKFESPDPELGDLLPTPPPSLKPLSSFLATTPSPSPSVLATLSIRNMPLSGQGSVSGEEILFTDVDAFSASVQASYLLGRVMEYMRGAKGSEIADHGQRESLERSLLAFAVSVLRQAPDSALRSRYCTSYFCVLNALAILLQHSPVSPSTNSSSHATTTLSSLLSPSPSPAPLSCCSSSSIATTTPTPTSTSKRTTLALHTLTRMYRILSLNLDLAAFDINQVPPFELYSVYMGTLLHVRYVDDNEQQSSWVVWRGELGRMLGYLELSGRKWSVAYEYIEDINAELEARGL